MHSPASACAPLPFLCSGPCICAVFYPSLKSSRKNALTASRACAAVVGLPPTCGLSSSLCIGVHQHAAIALDDLATPGGLGVGCSHDLVDTDQPEVKSVVRVR